MRQRMTDIVGYVGMVLLLFAFLCLIIGYLNSKGWVYNFLNLVGVICVGINVYKQKAWPALFLQIAWGIIAITGIIKFFI